MKRVVSISLGSSKRDKTVRAGFFGTDFEISRIGTDGDMEKYRRMVTELDGKVDAFGVGGTDIYLWAGDKRYTWREPLSLMEGAKQTPFVDGSGLKHTLERETVERLERDGTLNLPDTRVLMVSMVDRIAMAEALAARARSIVFGDILFGIGLPVPIRSLGTAKTLASLLLPIIVRLPYKWFYPTGEKQEQNTPKFARHFADADLIAGDFHLIRRFMPPDLTGKDILTNTTTEDDVQELRRRGVDRLITTTPVLDGRSFGTNVMEAVVVVLSGKRPEELTRQDYLSTLEALNWSPRVEELNAGERAKAERK